MFYKQWEERQTCTFIHCFFKTRGSYWYSPYFPNKTNISLQKFLWWGMGKHELYPYFFIQGEKPALVTV